MKPLITLLVVHALACCTTAQTVGQWELRKRTSTGMQSYGITAEDGKALGFTSGVPAMLTISGGGGAGLDNVASTITGGTLTLAGTLTTGRTLTVRDLAGTIALTSDLSAYLTTSSAASTYEPIITAGTTSQYYRGDKSWQTLNATAVGLGNVSNALQLVAANNLSDLANAATARTNLGLGTLATQNATISDYLTSATAATTYQPLSSTLTTLSSATAAGLALMDDANAAAQRATLGLGNVDNTADADKPISTATQTALDAKAPLASPTFTGTVTLGTGGLISKNALFTTRTLTIANEVIGWDNINGSGKWTSLRPNEPSVSGHTYFNPNGSLVSTADTGSVTNAMLAGSIAASKLVGTDIATLGTITSGTWQGSIIAPAYLGTGSSITTKYLRGDGTWQTIAGGGDALTTNPLSQFASTTSSQFAGVISDETGTGAVVLASSPTLTTPNLGTPSAATLTNATGLPLSTGVTGTLPIDNGGTGQTSQTNAFDALAPTTTKGDLIVSNGTDNIRVPVGGTNGHVLTVDSAEAAGVKWAAASGGGSGATDSQLYTASSTWTNPSPSTPRRVFVRLVGGGAGGGSGRKGAAGTDRYGGSGGSPAAVVETWFLTTELASSVSVTIGAGGAGGAAVSANSTSGNNGTAGGATTFSTVTAVGGLAGVGGTAASANQPGGKSSSCLFGLTTAASLGAGSGSNTTGATVAGSAASFPTGGGGGGGLNTSNIASSGGAGGLVGEGTHMQSVAGGTAGTVGVAGGAGNSARGVGTGGGGGGASSSGNGGDGGAGGGFGSGGGGGGAATNDVGNSGAGGTGASGYALIITY